MRIGTIIAMPSEYSRFARIKDNDGVGYTLDPSHLPKGAEIDDEFAYSVDIWENDSGLAYNLKEE